MEHIPPILDYSLKLKYVDYRRTLNFDNPWHCKDDCTSESRTSTIITCMTNSLHLVFGQTEVRQAIAPLHSLMS